MIRDLRPGGRGSRVCLFGWHVHSRKGDGAYGSSVRSSWILSEKNAPVQTRSIACWTAIGSGWRTRSEGQLNLVAREAEVNLGSPASIGL